ncbi:MAG: glycosyltransferase family 2 protein [Bavariicoccus seileri]|uniref:glycosyltransferase family 2 protein n=1 Tax=Bavariicoccus seileri TaxID=549685 RepID=UPI003F9804C7
MISIIIPCYNEEETIPFYLKAIAPVRHQVSEPFEFIFVNDGSTDHTLSVLRKASTDLEGVRFISFSRNFGKEAALLAGLREAKGDYVAVMDVDLQDPPELLVKMYDIITTKNVDCVATRRDTREGEPVIRSFFAELFYKIVNKISSTKMVDGARDFRLMTRQMVDAILSLTEYNRFSKGLFEWVGFETEYIAYDNVERSTGTSKWNFWSLFSYSIDGIINFSEMPLNIASVMGALACLFSGIAMIYIIIRTLVFGDPTSGWPSLVTIVLFVGGLQLLSLGIIGKYISKIFLETKRRPNYIIKEKSDEDTSSKW